MAARLSRLRITLPCSRWPPSILGVNSAIAAVNARSRQVPRVWFDFAVRGPLGPFSPQVLPTDSDRGAAPYPGGTLTVPF